MIEGLALENSRPTERSGIISHTEKSNGTIVKCFKCPLCGYSEIEENKNNTLPLFEEWPEEDKKTFQEFCEWGRRNCK